MSAQIGFIGIGNMGSAMLKGALHVFDKTELIYTDVAKSLMEKISEETGVSFVNSNEECVKNANMIVLAVKPQYYDIVLKDIKDYVTPKHIVISIAPGITIDFLKKELGEDKRIVRAMPNTPALIGEGMTGISYDVTLFRAEELTKIHAFFDSFGKARVVEERLMNAVVCASGSSPAYVYMFIEALADSAVKYGIPRKDAYEFVAQTVLGSAKMVLETGKHPAELKDMVCSPGGTTIAAVSALEEAGFRSAVIKAADACYEKCTKLKG